MGTDRIEHKRYLYIYIYVSLRCLVQVSEAGLEGLKAWGCGGVNSSHTVPVQYPLQSPLKTYGSSTVHIKYLKGGTYLSF